LALGKRSGISRFDNRSHMGSNYAYGKIFRGNAVEQGMTKLSWIIPVAFLFASNLAVAGQDSVKTSGSWAGVIINSGCTVDEAFAEAAKCTDNVQGTRLVLYDDTTRQIYRLDPQGQALSSGAVAIAGSATRSAASTGEHST
jgi:hypothetical protein